MPILQTVGFRGFPLKAGPLFSNRTRIFSGRRSGEFPAGSRSSCSSGFKSRCPTSDPKIGGKTSIRMPLDMELVDRLAEAERRIGHRFKNRDLLAQALRHASSADDRLDSNERLEFLGDAILGVIVCRELFDRFPDLLEGELTKIKSNVVSRRVCAEIAEELGLGPLLKLGKGMNGRGEMPSSLLAAVLESVIGAMHEDAGFERARQFVLEHIEPRIDHAARLGHQHNFKSVLQQVFQRKGLGPPTYHVLEEQGPDHAKCFSICVGTGDRRFAACWGPNKKQSEQQAALSALIDLGYARSDESGDIQLEDECWTEEPVAEELLGRISTLKVPDSAGAPDDAVTEAEAVESEPEAG